MTAEDEFQRVIDGLSREDVVPPVGFVDFHAVAPLVEKSQKN